METLDLSDNGFTASCWPCIAEIVTENYFITNLTLSGNGLGRRTNCKRGGNAKGGEGGGGVGRKGRSVKGRESEGVFVGTDRGLNVGVAVNDVEEGGGGGGENGADESNGQIAGGGGRNIVRVNGGGSGSGVDGSASRGVGDANFGLAALIEALAENRFLVSLDLSQNEMDDAAGPYLEK